MFDSSSQPLCEGHDLIALDLDGVVYIGTQAVAGAVDSLARLRALGRSCAFITNNASRPPREVAAKLIDLGIHAEDHDVVNSAQAAAHLLADQLPAGSKVFVIGGTGLEEALTQFGLVPVSTPEVDVLAVAQGYGPEMPWKQVLDGVILVDKGLLWVATNTDMTIPLAQGVGPGNGALVKLVSDFTSRQPVVAGKPQRPLFQETQDRLGAGLPLMVGDRLDTDIKGANDIGWSSLLVMTGVTGIKELVSAEKAYRPNFIGADLSSLLIPHANPIKTPTGWSLGGWFGEVESGQLRISGGGLTNDWWRVLAVTSWDHHDSGGSRVGIADLVTPWVD